MATWSSWRAKQKQARNLVLLSRVFPEKNIAGEFKVKLPDGRLQVVTYEADKDGFRPKISYKIDPELAGELPEPKLPNEIMRPAVIYITPKPTYGYEGRSKPKPTTDYGRPKRPQYRPILTPSGGYDLRPKKRRHSNLDYDLTLSATEAAYAMPPSVSYSSPKTLFNNAKSGFDTYGPEPVINFLPREPESIKYDAPKMSSKPFLTPSTDYFLSNSIADPPLIRRHDVVDLEVQSFSFARIVNQPCVRICVTLRQQA